MTITHDAPNGGKTKNSRLTVNDVVRTLNISRFRRGEDIPGPEFHPESPELYGVACAYDMASRLVKWCRKNGRISDARVIWSEFGKLLFRDGVYLIRLMGFLGMRYHDFVNSHATIGWLDLDTSLDVWCNNTFITPVARALCTYLAYRGLPFVELDSSGAAEMLSFPDFSPCGVFESIQDAMNAAPAFYSAFIEIEESVFGRSTLSTNRTDKTECLLAYGSLEQAVVPEIALQPYGDEKHPDKYIEGIKMSLALRRRSFGDIVPVDISSLSTFFEAGLHCDWNPKKMPDEFLDNLTDEQSELLDALFGDSMSDESTYDLSKDCDSSVKGAPVEGLEKESRKYAEFDLRGWIEAKFKEAVSEDWSGDEYRTGRIKCLTGLRLAAKRITDDKKLYATFADLCSAWRLVERPLFQPCDECPFFDVSDCIDVGTRCPGQDCRNPYYFPLSLAVDFAKKCRNDGVFVCDASSAWPLMTGIFTDYVDNLLAVIFAHGVQTLEEKDGFSEKRIAGWESPIQEIADIILDKYGVICDELVDKTDGNPVPLWGMAFTKGSIAVRGHFGGGLS